VLLSRTNGFSFFIELIGEKQHVGSCHTNGSVPQASTFLSFTQEEKIPDKLVQFQITYPVAHCQTLLSTPNQTIESQFAGSVT
jgi:hypothetical protein